MGQVVVGTPTPACLRALGAGKVYYVPHRMEERRMIAVAAAGALTPVGLDLSDTMAALYTHVQLVEDLDVLDNDGEPLSGMKIRFAEEIAGPARTGRHGPRGGRRGDA